MKAMTYKTYMISKKAVEVLQCSGSLIVLDLSQFLWFKLVSFISLCKNFSQARVAYGTNLHRLVSDFIGQRKMKQKTEENDKRSGQSPSDMPLQAYIISQSRNRPSNERSRSWNEVNCVGLPHIKTVLDFRNIHIN